MEILVYNQISYFYALNLILKWPGDPTRPDPSITVFAGLFLRSESIKDRNVKFWCNLSIKIEASKFVIDIFDSLEAMRFSAS